MLIRLAIRDLQFRRRRFAIAIVGASLVFGLSLVVQGLAESFDRETSDTLSNLGVGRWFVSSRSTGPFTGFTPLGQSQIDALETGIGGTASRLLTTRQPIGSGSDRQDAGLVGVEPGALGGPRHLAAGRAVAGDGEAVVSEIAEVPVGKTILVGGVKLRVVGTVDLTLLGGGAVVYTSLRQAQTILGAGPLVTVVVGSTAPRRLPPEVVMLSGSEVHEATLRPLEAAIGTIAMMRSILWLVAALIVGSILYLNALERSRDVAVMKAIGVSSGSIIGSMLCEAAVITVVSGAVADVISVAIAPVFPMRVTITPTWLVVLPLFALVVSGVACLGAVRRAVSVEPAMAFGGA